MAVPSDFGPDFFRFIFPHAFKLADILKLQACAGIIVTVLPQQEAVLVDRELGGLVFVIKLLVIDRVPVFPFIGDRIIGIIRPG
jgi:hypothetical protein